MVVLPDGFHQQLHRSRHFARWRPQRSFRSLKTFDGSKRHVMSHRTSNDKTNQQMAYLSKWRPRPDEFQDDGVSILFDSLRNLSVDHDRAQLVPPRSNVVHHHLVGRQFVFDGFASAFRFRFQFDAVAQLANHLHPQSGLQTKTNIGRKYTLYDPTSSSRSATRRHLSCRHANARPMQISIHSSAQLQRVLN